MSADILHLNQPKALATAGREAQDAIAACDEDRANGIEPRDGAALALSGYVAEMLRGTAKLDATKWEALLLRLWAAGYLRGQVRRQG